MYIKVKCEGNHWKAENGKVLGRQVGYIFGGRPVLQDEEGNQYVAIYGTKNSEGKFVEFCKESGLSCLVTCSGAGRLDCCRYNRNVQKNAGYYVDITP